MAKSAQIIWDVKTGLYKCTFPIFWKLKSHKDFIDVLKKSIPSGERSYDPVTHEWYIEEKWFLLVKQLSEAVFGSVYTYEKQTASNWTAGQGALRATDTNADLKVFDELLRAAGVVTNGTDIKTLSLAEAIKLYRRAALAFHPDRNPNGATDMSRLNEVFTRLKNPKGGFYK